MSHKSRLRKSVLVIDPKAQVVVTVRKQRLGQKVYGFNPFDLLPTSPEPFAVVADKIAVYMVLPETAKP